MKASFRWLRALVPGLPEDAGALSERLTAAGLEVEATHAYGSGAESCVLAWVVSARAHPTKSGLKLVTVDRGGSVQEVVCGAPNVPAPGAVVVLAPLGAHLPAKGLTIARREIGGVASEGMLCSEAELGLSDDASGILVFPAGFAEPGARLTDVVPEATDTIFEIGLTPNRPDGLGHVGLAREAAALFGIAWRVPSPEAPSRRTARSVADDFEIRIEDAERCPHYGATLVTGATVAPSPPGVRYRLSALGVRPISNAVDVTNLMMLEYGHPMHAFDADKIRGGQIVVRRARDGEELLTLDGVARKLVSDDLVIADAAGALALAGVMGGRASEVTDATTRVVLECAYFDPRGVRRAARRHGLHSESSHRFERGVDWGGTARVLEHAAGVLCRLTGGVASKDDRVVNGRSLAQARVMLRGSRMSALLGVEVPLAEARATLERLGFACSAATTDGALEALVPSHRPDVTREADLVDEVVRVRGMDTVPTRLPAVRATRAVHGRETMLRRARGAASSLGLSEAVTFGFTSKKALDALGAPPPLTLENPLTEETGVMRTSLLPGLLEAVGRARRYGVADARLFTTGAVFSSSDEPETASAAPGVRERASFGAVLAGCRPAYLSPPEPFDAWDASGLATALARRLTHATTYVVPLRGAEAPRHLHPRGAAAICVQDTTIGLAGPLHPDVLDAFDLDGTAVIVVELDLDALDAVGRRHPTYAPIPRFPAATRDVSLVVRGEIAAGDVLAALREVSGPLAVGVTLFDRFVGSPVPEGHTNLAFRIVYQSDERTLTDAEVDAAQEKAVAVMKARFGAALRA